MFRNEYDREVTTFSPQGRLFQVEYALNAVSFGLLIVGICTQHGTILCSAKRSNERLIENTADQQKISIIADHVACASAGLVADARMLINHARFSAMNHWFSFDEPMPAQSIVKSVAEHALDFSGISNAKKMISRPFGVSLLFAAYTKEDGASLYSADPNGNTYKWKASALGAGSQGANEMLKQGYKEDMSLEDAMILALRVVREVMENKMTSDTVELCVVGPNDEQQDDRKAKNPETKINFVVDDRLQNLINKLETREHDLL